MCVAVTLLPGAQVTREEMADMQRANRDGVGIAWADGTETHWIKDERMGPDTALHFLKAHADKPRLLHFRYGTAGGTSTALCHPFTLDDHASTDAEGSTPSPLVIHNGVWSDWQKPYMKLKARDLLPDTGPWSDTRLAVWLGVRDPDWIAKDLVGTWGKVAILHRDGHIEHIGPWVALREGVQVSNLNWQPVPAKSYGRGESTYGYWERGQWHKRDSFEKTAPVKTKEKSNAQR